MKKKANIAELKKVATRIRKHIVVMSGRANASHSGSALSPVEIVTSLYFNVMDVDPKRPLWPDRDRFILSKGHGGAVLYAALAERGYFPKSLLDGFCLDTSPLVTHPVRGSVPGVEATTGSLGHGLSTAVGIALGARYDKKKYLNYVVLSDGECDEGSVWEATMYAGFHKLDNIIAFVDYNKIQSYGRTKEILDLEPLAAKFRAFKWHAQEIDGHNFAQILKAISVAKRAKGKPSIIIAHTVKGKGISYMEDKLEWHYRSPTGELGKQALKELRRKS
jgi:transketolase